MNTHKIILSLPAKVQEEVFTLALQTGRLWKIPQFACLKRWYITCGASERSMTWIVKHAHSWHVWVEFWLEEARRTRLRAERELVAGHVITARERFHEAAMAFAMALWQTSDFGRREELYPNLLEVFEQFARLNSPALVRLDIPFQPAPMPAHLRLPRHVEHGERLPVVVLIQGMDTIKETMAFTENALLARGLATLTVDQPGTGEARMRGVCLTGCDCLEAAAHAIIDFASHRPELDPDRIGVYGVSFGGFVAPYFAAVERRFKSLAVFGAMWEFPFPRGMAANPFYGPVMGLMTGIEDRDGIAAVFEQLKLRSIAHQITAATAVLQGTDDLLFVDGARRLHEAIAGEKELRMIEGGDHALTWHPEEPPFLADWLADHLVGHHGQSPVAAGMEVGVSGSA